MGLLTPGRLCRSTKGVRGVRLLCALLAAAAFTPVPAAAQQDNAVMRSQIHGAATLSNDADMDFGQIMPNAGGGTVVLSPSPAPTCTTTGGLIRTGTCKAAMFIGFAFYQADLRVMRPSGNSITLIGPAGATMVVDNFTFGSTGTTVYLGANGNSPNHRFRSDALDGVFAFYVGGRLNVGGNQLPGIYNGTFEIRITYN